MHIATRKSLLAIKQAEMTKKLFEENQMPCEFVFMETAGDKNAHPLFSGKGIFIKELQTRLIEGTADIAVHSLKDLPVIQTPKLAIQALLPRASKEDVLIISPIVLTQSGLDQLSIQERNQISFAELNSRLWKSAFFRENKIGTSSLRRALIVKQYMSSQPREFKLRDGAIEESDGTSGMNSMTTHLRGNVDSRLKKVRNNEYSCILLAKAGLERLGLYSTDVVDMFTLDPTVFVPAAGQGIIAIETMPPCGSTAGSSSLSSRGSIAGSSSLSSRGSIAGSSSLSSRGSIAGSSSLSSRGSTAGSSIQTICQKITSISACIEAGLERVILFLLGSDCYTPVGVHFNGEFIFVITEENGEFLKCQIPVSKDNLNLVNKLLKEHQYLYAPFFESLCKSTLAQSFKQILMENKFL